MYIRLRKYHKRRVVDLMDEYQGRVEKVFKVINGDFPDAYITPREIVEIWEDEQDLRRETAHWDVLEQGWR